MSDLGRKGLPQDVEKLAQQIEKMASRVNGQFVIDQQKSRIFAAAREGEKKANSSK